MSTGTVLYGILQFLQLLNQYKYTVRSHFHSRINSISHFTLDWVNERHILSPFEEVLKGQDKLEFRWSSTVSQVAGSTQ